MDDLSAFPVGVLLASASPRRRDLLLRSGLPVCVRPVSIDETPQRGESPRTYVARVASAKGRAARGRDACWLDGGAARVLLAADTTVVLDNQLLGKPADVEEARAMLRALSGRQHRVLTAVYGATASAEQQLVDESVIEFRSLTTAEIEAYLRTGEPFDKAGSYGIQGIGEVFVETLRGSFSSVAGLPLARVELLLKALQIDSWLLRQVGRQVEEVND